MKIKKELHKENKIMRNEQFPKRLYNPKALKHDFLMQVKSIELTDEYTRIDFLHAIPCNDWWIYMDPECYIQTKGSDVKYRLIQAIGIPVKPERAVYFKREIVSYILIFPALPKNTICIDIIENTSTQHPFNFREVTFGKWGDVPRVREIW